MTNIISGAIKYDSNGRIKLKETYQYDGKGTLIATRRVGPDCTVWLRHEIYDESDKHATTRVIDPMGNEVSADKWDEAD